MPTLASYSPFHPVNAANFSPEYLKINTAGTVPTRECLCACH